jgi:hypothetical protein
MDLVYFFDLYYLRLSNQKGLNQNCEMYNGMYNGKKKVNKNRVFC